MFMQLLSLKRKNVVYVFLIFLVFLLPITASSGPAVPTFSLQFLPSTIGPGSITTLEYFIDNSFVIVGVTDLAFTHVLPAGVIIATPGRAISDCGGTLTAVDGSGTITFSGGALGVMDSCRITVDVTSSTPGTHQSVTGVLTTSLGNSGTATGDLIVATDRPGFTKSFSPGSLSFGGRSTLTFTIDNTANPDTVSSLAFSDNLPSGMVIADPANVVTDCFDPLIGPGTLIALPGTGVISYSYYGSASFPAVATGNSCTVSVDVTATGIGLLGNTSGDLLTAVFLNSNINSGKAGNVLNVTAETLHLQKAFINDPVPPGGTVDLEFSITNFDRISAATNISFTDDLDATLTGLVATGLPQRDICGAGSSLSGNSLLTLTGGSLSPGGTCTFTVTLQIPGASASGNYVNTTSAITGNLGGEGVVSAPATETLFIFEAPIFTKTFLNDPVAAGGPVTLRFTITNTSLGFSATGISFTDDLNSVITGLAANGLVSGSVAAPLLDVCGIGSELTVFDPSIVSPADPTQLVFTGGSLAPAGSPGDSCTFDVVLDIPAGIPSGSYRNTTSLLTAFIGPETSKDRAATDMLDVVGAPDLTKSFMNDPVLPGDTVTLQFTLSHSEDASVDATLISFTDNLNAVLPGLAALNLPQNDICGPGSQLTGTSLLTFTGGTLAPGVSCTFNVTLQVPANGLYGNYINTTGNVTATINGLQVTGNPAMDDLLLSPLSFAKDFTDDPVIPGDMVTLEFTIDNTGSIVDVTDIFFTDDLSKVLAGLAVNDTLPLTDVCGTGSQLIGAGSSLTLAGGNLLPGTLCTFSVTLQVPANTESDTYQNITSQLSATVGTTPVVLEAATASLVVDANLLGLTKSFSDDPALSGGTVNLEFSLTNRHPALTASAIAFSDDLDVALSGLTATGLPVSVCGGTLAGTSNLIFIGGSLAAGETCTFSVVLNIPSGLPSGTVVTNTTSEVTGDINALAVTGAPASDDLQISFLTLNKSFSGKTRAGETVSLSFTLQNNNLVSTASDLQFSDNLDSMFPGLIATGLPVSNVCGTGSVLNGTGIINMSGAALGPGESCTFSVNLQVPVSAPHGFFLNTTSFLTVQGENVASPATSILEVDNDPDGDGVLDQNDNCPDMSNPDQANNDGDSQGDVCDPDDDNDTVPDLSDNCPFTANTDQMNFDGDETGDVCDRDDDNDGIPDVWELNNGLNPYNASDANLDNDGDGFTNMEEYQFNSDPNVYDTDENGNGVPDRIDHIRATVLPLWYLLNHM